MKDLILLANDDVGLACTAFFAQHHRDDVGLVVVKAPGPIMDLAAAAGLPTHVFGGEADLVARIEAEGLKPDAGFLLWWPHILHEPLLSLPRLGFVNTHPSLLPFNRGKHYSFWALVEQAPFGVTLHFADASVDGGDILAQTHIDYDWAANGESLYKAAKAAMVTLVSDFYPQFRAGDYVRRPQDPARGSSHRGAEIAAATVIDLDAPTTARALLNRLRAKTFTGLDGCRFEDGGAAWDVTVSIRKIT